jgi:hypothetical protein
MPLTQLARSFSFFQSSLLCAIALCAVPNVNYAQSSSTSAPVSCDNRVPIGQLAGVLYKPENLHGSRGPTFLVQNVVERTNKKRIEIRDVLCRRISSFGLFSTDFPFGARYYQRSGGSGHTPQRLLALARRAGSSAILVEGVDGKWIVISNPLKREGTIYS